MTKKNEGKKRKMEEVYYQKKRKLYVKPKLTEYGRIETLTHGSSGLNREASGTFQRP
jgi:hypothetical protein